jgi:hypothetical protein
MQSGETTILDNEATGMSGTYKITCIDGQQITNVGAETPCTKL